MDKREVEKMLYSYPYLIAENKNIKLELERLEVVGFKNISYDFKPKSYNKSSVVETETINREKEINRLMNKINTNISSIRQIENSLEVLNEYEKIIIKKIYFERYKSNQIAQQLYLTPVYISRLKNIALRKLTYVLH